MNTSRFINFGKYDFTINKSFYRNISLVSIFGATGIALAGFFGRWMDFKNTVLTFYNLPTKDMSMEEILDAVRDMSDPSSTPATTVFLFALCLLMMSIFAGYTFHNLRNKQGRITELTMPATNLERWTWHVLTTFVGGFAVITVSVLFADAVNAILNLIVYKSTLGTSLFINVARWFTVIIPEGTPFVTTGASGALFGKPETIWAIRALMTTGIFFNLSFFILVNSMKYKYNIILTFIIMQVLQMAITITVTTMAMYHDTSRALDVDIEPYIFAASAVNAVLAATCLWASYRKYYNAQITSRFNK